jgi:DNA-binding NarL/FixJ family response regulator
MQFRSCCWQYECVDALLPGAGRGSIIVSVVDDHPDLCYGVLARLSQSSSSFIPGVMASAVPEFVAREDAAGPRSDVVLLDLTLKDGTSPAANVAELRNRGYVVVIYTGEERPERLQGTLRIGAQALVRKDEAACLEDALRAVMSGDPWWVSPLMAAVVLTDSGRPRLSPMQIETLRLYATGVTAQKVATVLGCALETVKSHLKEVKLRYEVNGDHVYTKTDLLRVALRDGHVHQDWYRHES